jgi:hypothetical protein
MTKILSKKCNYNGCNNTARYNIVGEKNPIYCKDHKDDKMINITSKKCIYNGCETSANFNFEGVKGVVYCSKHMKEGMVNKSLAICIYEGCKKNARYNFKNNKYGIYCYIHKLEHMVNVCGKICAYENCTTMANFKNGDGINMYCVIHKPSESTIYNKCVEPGCNKDAIFKKTHARLLTHCINHKSENDIKCCKKCRYNDCERYGNYYEHSKTESYCFLHKTDKMKHLTVNCAHNENVIITEDDGEEIEFFENVKCTNLPEYYNPNEKHKLYCIEHKSSEMIMKPKKRRTNHTIVEENDIAAEEPSIVVETPNAVAEIPGEVDNSLQDYEDLFNEFMQPPEASTPKASKPKFTVKRKKYTSMDYESDDEDESEYDCDNDEDYDSDE